jgi:hypothetical protein
MWASAMALPSSAASAAASAARLHQRQSPCSTKSVAPSSVSGMSCATSPMRQPAGRHLDVAASACSRPGQQREQAGLAGAVAADQADFSPGLRVTLALIEHHLDAAQQRDVLQNNHGSGRFVQAGGRRG